jgi:hypothetical protein
MMAVPRRSDQAAEEAGGARRGVAMSEPTDRAAGGSETVVLPLPSQPVSLAALPPGPDTNADPGLYAVLGLDPSVSDVDIQTTYRRMAAKLLANGFGNQELKQLNVAYQVLGNPLRRAEYDRLRMTRSLVVNPPTAIRPGAK